MYTRYDTYFIVLHMQLMHISVSCHLSMLREAGKGGRGGNAIKQICQMHLGIFQLFMRSIKVNFNAVCLMGFLCAMPMPTRRMRDVAAWPGFFLA